MLEIVTPLTLFHTQVSVLQQALPSVLDGQESGVHAARVATRRIRELLPLSGAEPRWASLDDLRSRFKRIGRSLGRVRDADVRISLLALLESRIPHAAPTLVLVRQRREHERLECVRKLVKKLERLDAVRLVDMLARHRPSRLAFLDAVARGRGWRRELHSLIAERAQSTEEAIAHATGVYFPNRLHAARIAIKRLRYATEIVHQTASADRSEAIRELKKAQELLGDLHDRQELSDHLADECRQAEPGAPGGDDRVALVRHVIDAEARHLHGRYVERRARLVAICRESAAVPRTAPGATAPIVALAAIAIMSGVYAANRSQTGARLLEMRRAG